MASENCNYTLAVLFMFACENNVICSNFLADSVQSDPCEICELRPPVIVFV